MQLESNQKVNLTQDQKQRSKRNRSLAYLHFFPECNGKCRKKWCLHHKDETLFYKDIERYIEWNIDDVTPMTIKDHNSLHHKNKTRSKETLQKISNTCKNRNTEERKRLHNTLSIAMRGLREGKKNPAYGKHWWINNKGEKILSAVKPNGDGWVRGYKCKPLTDEQKTLISEAGKGRVWWNNGKEQTTSRTCPNEGWIRGRIK